MVLGSIQRIWSHPKNKEKRGDYGRTNRGEAWDLIVPISRGDFKESHYYAELGDILIGNVEAPAPMIQRLPSLGRWKMPFRTLVVSSFLEE